MSYRTPCFPPRIDHATLIAARTERDASSRAEQREACKKILAAVYRVVAAVLGPRSPNVDDATQDAFMRVHKGIPTFKPDPKDPASSTKWINIIALHVAIDVLNRGLRRGNEAPLEDNKVDALEHVVATDLDEAIDRTKLAEALLRLLDEQHRAILVLRHWSGHTDEEIAETLGIPLGTVKTRARAARAKLEQYVRGRAEGSKE